MQCSDIKSEVAYKVGKRDPLERKDIPATAVKMHIDVAEIMKQNDRYDTCTSPKSILTSCQKKDIIDMG